MFYLNVILTLYITENVLMRNGAATMLYAIKYSVLYVKLKTKLKMIFQ